MADMKQLLLKLGEKLVQEHNFLPANICTTESKKKSTDTLVKFLVWLDKTPEAREELENMGFSFHRTVPFQ